MDVRLPNGQIIRGVPDGTPKEAIMAKAISAGLATEQDFGIQSGQIQTPEPARQSAASPRMARAQQSASNREDDQAAFEQTLRENIPLYKGDLSGLEEIGGAPELNEMSTRALKASLAANLIGSDFELAQAIKAQIPEATFSRDEDLNLIATMPSGGSFYLNAPGFSGQDAVKTATRVLGFTPAGRGVSGVSGQALKTLAGRSAATEAGLQGLEAGLGGEFDPSDVAVAGAAAPIGQVVGQKVATGLQSRAADKALKQAAPTIEALKNKAREVYNQIDELGVSIPKDKAQSLAADSISMLKKQGYNQKIQPKIAGVIDELEQFAQNGGTVGQLDTLRKVAANAAKSTEASEVALASRVIEKIDDFMDDFAPPAEAGKDVSKLYKEARGLWSRAKKAEMIEMAFEKAGNQASGFENGIRVQLRAILNNPKKMRGFTAEEKQAMKDVVQGTSTANVLKFLGRFGLSEGQATNMLGGLLGAAGGAAVAGPAGAAGVPMLGQTARMAAQQVTKSNANLAASLVRAGKNGREIALQYVKNVPKSQRSIDELTGLLLGDGVDISTIGKISDPFIRDSALAAGLILQVKPQIDEALQDDGQQ